MCAVLFRANANFDAANKIGTPFELPEAFDVRRPPNAHKLADNYKHPAVLVLVPSNSYTAPACGLSLDHRRSPVVTR